MKTLGWKAERDFPSREYAAAWHAQILWSQEWHRRSTTGPEMPMDAICRKAEEMAKHARLADIPEAGDELDRDDMRDLPPLEVLQRAEAGKRGAPSNRAGDIPAFLHEGEEAFDRFVCESEGGEGGGL